MSQKSSSQMRFVILHSQRLIANLWSYWLQQQYPDSQISTYLTLSDALTHGESSKATIGIFDISHARDDWEELLEEVCYRKIVSRTLAIVGDPDDRLIASLRHAKLDGIVASNEDSLIGMLKAVRCILVGESYISPRFKQILFSQTPQVRSVLSDLTNTEALILGAIGAGHSKTAVAAELKISPLTVQTHRKRIMHKLQVTREGEMVAQAFRLGLVKASAHGVHRPGFETALSTRNRKLAKNCR